MLAVDLSLSSLCYAKRKTRELGLTNITYAQADILRLGTLPRRFDVIESSGVLHHLADPLAGWRVLLSLLRPGGFMSGDGRYALTFPSAHADCLSASGTCKCARMRTLRQPGTTAVLIGDGASDFCAAREEADFVFAKGALLDFCREQALPHMAYTDFYDVKRVLSNPQQGPHDAERRAADPTFAGYFLHDTAAAHRGDGPWSDKPHWAGCRHL